MYPYPVAGSLGVMPKDIHFPVLGLFYAAPNNASKKIHILDPVIGRHDKKDIVRLLLARAAIQIAGAVLRPVSSRI